MKLKEKIKKNPFLYDKLNDLFLYKRYIEIKYFYKQVLKRDFKKIVGYELNLEEPKTFNEKLQWLKLYDRREIHTKSVDKNEVRTIVKEKIGEEYLIEQYGVYEDVNEIDIKKLPDKFVLKPNHTSGRVILCTDKSEFDLNLAKKKLKKWMKQNYYYQNGEWCYKDVKPKIICEKLLEKDIVDYKFYCFNGEPKYVYIYCDRKEHVKTKVYDLQWKEQEFVQGYERTTRQIEKPKKLEEMIELARKLSKDFDFVRVDFYETEGKVYFGELTFYPYNGMGRFKPTECEEYDKKLGEMLKITNKNKENT